MDFFNFPPQGNQPEFNPDTVTRIELDADTINDASSAEQVMFLSAALAQCNELSAEIYRYTAQVIDPDSLDENLCTEEGLFPAMSVFYLATMEEFVHELVESVALATDTPLVSEMVDVTGSGGDGLGVDVFDDVAELSVTSNKIHDAWHDYLDPVQFPEENFTRDGIVERAHVVLPKILGLCERFNGQVVSLLNDESVQRFAQSSLEDMLRSRRGY